MKLYGHPWSINTRKALMVFAEKRQGPGEKAEEPTFVPVMIPKGEHKQPGHLALHPFGKVPVLEDEGFVLYETRAINLYLNQRLEGPSLVPENPRDKARMDQFLNVMEAYFLPFAQGFIVELLFRRYLGGEQNAELIRTGREGIQESLDVVDRALESSPYLAGKQFSLADIHWMPYLEYMQRIGEGEHITRRKHLNAWWQRVSERPTWAKVARTGQQPYDPA